MNNPIRSLGSFFVVIARGQSYLNLIYLLAAFPLGVFYFVFLVSGLSTGISLMIVWIGIPILFLVSAIWLLLAYFERCMAIYVLKEDVTPLAAITRDEADIWTRIKGHFINPVTWKSLLYLLLKFPLGIATFIILITMLSLTMALLTMPITYQFVDNIRIGLVISPNQPLWQINNLRDALLVSAIGFLMWPITLHLTNGLSWIHAKFARLMLGVNPLED